MKASIKITMGDYGFSHNWTLVVELGRGKVKEFWLGQDVKFLNRVLGVSPSDVVEAIGSRNIQEPKVNKRLASYILDALELDKQSISRLSPWELASH